ncbi:MAG: hypothetical protein IK095_06285 [Oscillospiraceae bacterium]|nr:hypothetical protein [Oscillospiraceae bacterium]
MSDKVSREQLHTMPMAELEELIRALPADCDPDLWLLVMDVYTERSDRPAPDTEASLREFFSDHSGSTPIFAEAPAPAKRRRKAVVTALRFALIAAILVGLFTATAYAMGWSGLRERAVHTGYETTQAVIEEDGTSHLEPAEAVLLLPTGYRDSPEYQAAAEWFAYELEYRETKVAESVAAGGGAWDWLDTDAAEALLGNSIYGAGNAEMAEKLLEIRARYGLALHSSMVFPPTEAEFYRLTGTKPFFHGEGYLAPMYVFEDGAYKAEGGIEIGGASFAWSLSRYRNGTIPAYMSLIQDPGAYEEWGYRNAFGNEVCIDCSKEADAPYLDPAAPEEPRSAHTVILHYTTEDAFLTLYCQVPGGREGAEALADAFDFAAACEGVPAENGLLEIRPYTGEKTAIGLSELAQTPEIRGAKAFWDWYTGYRGSLLAAEGCVVGCDEETEPELRAAFERIAGDYGLAYADDWNWILNGYVYPHGYNGGVSDFDAWTERLSEDELWARLGQGRFDAVELQDVMLYPGAFTVQAAAYRLHYIQKGTLYTALCLAGELTAYRDEWLFETKCGELVCCALGGTDRYPVPCIVYETPTAYVLVVPNSPSVYSLQAIAWNMDFTQFR